ncbi:MAG: gliding motility-associated protein GldE [Fluviicola sp. XM-24bin1]|nr:MAG: gliding motility-associated protein GldE [Fluviicola sp. XM-24bin1]
MDDPSSYVSYSNIATAGFGGVQDYIFLVILLLLIAMSALVSGSEAAFFSLSPAEKEDLRNDTGKRANYVNKLLDKPQELLATILISNNFVNVAIVILSSSIMRGILEDTGISGTAEFLLEFVVITLTLLILGEVIPKIYANKRSLAFSKMMARPLYRLNNIPPISWIRLGLVSGTTLIQRRMRRGKVDVSTDELEQALALTKEEDSDDSEHKILEGIVKFGSTEVRQIMRPRLDVHALEISDSYQDVLTKILECGHSRLPVYEESFDKIVGVLFIKDLLPYLNSENEQETDWAALVRKPFFVTENRKIDDLLKDFQEKKVHIAMVVDEYGGTCGIVTLEDVLEEIVGEITDEFDDDELVYTKISDSEYLFEGKTALVDFYKVLNISEENLEIDTQATETIGGLIVEVAGRILKNNEQVTIGPLQLIVESSDKKRIKMVKAIKLEETKEV